MRIFITWTVAIVAVLLFGSVEAWAGGVGFENKSDTDLKFFTQGVLSNGVATKWQLWHLRPHHKTRVRCDGCVRFNFEIRTQGRHPTKYSLDLDKTYKLKNNIHTHKWDLFQ